MKYQATKKVVGGKLLRIKIDADEPTNANGEPNPSARIHTVQIHGDFFLHPEEAVTDIEQELQGIRLKEQPEVITRIILDALNRQNAAFIGVSAEDITATIQEALAGA